MGQTYDCQAKPMHWSVVERAVSLSDGRCQLLPDLRRQTPELSTIHAIRGAGFAHAQLLNSTPECRACHLMPKAGLKGLPHRIGSSLLIIIIIIKHSEDLAKVVDDDFRPSRSLIDAIPNSNNVPRAALQLLTPPVSFPQHVAGFILLSPTLAIASQSTQFKSQLLTSQNMLFRISLG